MDSDEPIYLDASMEMADAIRVQDWATVRAPQFNPEHPGLVKLIYGVGQVFMGPHTDLVDRLASARAISMAASVVTVALLAWVHPLAGLALATHTLHTKYGVQAYLDGLPLLWMSVAMVFGWRSRHEPKRWPFVLAGACWGAAMAGKWIHALPGVVLLGFLPSWKARATLTTIFVTSWWILDPSMGLSSLDRITQMVAAHHQYSVSLTEDTSILDPLFFLATGRASVWHPEVFSLNLDPFWFVAGIIGLMIRCRDSWGAFVTLWLLVPLAFLMVWETRWPQHAVVLVVPLCLGVGFLFDWVANRANRRFEPIGLHPPTSE